MEYLNSGHVAELIKELNFFDKINIKHTHEIELSIAGWFLKTQSDIRNSPKAESAEKSDNKQMDAIADLNYCLEFNNVPQTVRDLIIRARDVFIGLKQHH